MSGRPIGRLRAYAAGADAYDRGEPPQPPPAIPSHRMDAWLNGWTDQKAFTEHQTARRNRKRAKPGSNRFAIAGDESAPLGRFIRTTTGGRVFGYLRARRKTQPRLPRRTSLLRLFAVAWWLAIIGKCELRPVRHMGTMGALSLVGGIRSLPDWWRDHLPPSGGLCMPA
jgi:hypothetical protein